MTTSVACEGAAQTSTLLNPIRKCDSPSSVGHRVDGVTCHAIRRDVDVARDANATQREDNKGRRKSTEGTIIISRSRHRRDASHFIP